MRIAKVDSNQTEVVLALRSAGAIVKHVHTIKNLFDVLVFFRGQTYCVEIKDGSKSPSKRKLTPGELKCKSELESVGVEYCIVESVRDAFNMIGL